MVSAGSQTPGISAASLLDASPPGFRRTTEAFLPAIAGRKLIQWKNTSDVTNWFTSIPNTQKHSFTSFDIDSFYPSITESLLSKAISFAKNYTTISDKDIDIIMHCRKSLLFDNETAWTKKNHSDMFDLTMGSFDGAEVCELIGLFLLNNLSEKYGKNNVGLYRDDGLVLLRNASGPQSERTRKDITQESATNNRKRQRNIIWFNPPLGKNVQTNIGREFLNLIEKCFPPNHKLKKLFNRNNLKLSYSCTPNIKQIIDGHNKTILRQNTPSEEKITPKPRNCRKANNCPLKGKCLVKDVVYQATITTVEGTETYVGLTATEFKRRWRNHQMSFRHDSKRNDTELSKHLWQLKDQKKDFQISWKILAKAKSYSNLTKRCNLCNSEKYYILHKPNMATLNKRNELVSTCRHKFLLKVSPQIQSHPQGPIISS